MHDLIKIQSEFDIKHVSNDKSKIKFKTYLFLLSRKELNKDGVCSAVDLNKNDVSCTMQQEI